MGQFCPSGNPLTSPSQVGRYFCLLPVLKQSHTQQQSHANIYQLEIGLLLHQGLMDNSQRECNLVVFSSLDTSASTKCFDFFKTVFLWLKICYLNRKENTSF